MVGAAEGATDGGVGALEGDGVNELYRASKSMPETFTIQS